MATGGRRYDLIAIILVFLFAVVLEYQEAFSLIEDETLSYRQILRTHYGDPRFTTPSEDIVIVYTDEAFYEEYGVYPLRRVDLSTIIVRLAHLGASVIGVDMLLDFNSAYGEDPSVEDALQEAGTVLLVSQAQFDDDTYTGINRAIPRFDDFSESGYSNISANSAISQSIVRLRVYPEIAADGEWPFAVKAVAQYLQAEPSLEDGVLRIGDEVAVQLDQFNDIYIDYPLLPASGSVGNLRLHDVVGISASDLLFARDEEELSEFQFLIEDKIVLIGEVAEVAHDEFETPIGNVFGVEIIASTIATILNGGPLTAASWLVEFLVAMLMMALLLATRLVPNPLPRNLISLVLLLVYVFVCGFLYVSLGYVLSMSYVLIAAVTAIIAINARFYLAEMGQKALIRDAFGQYLSPRVVADLVKDPAKLALGGEEREMTAFFSDIAGFSTFSENMTPTELVHVLNDYLTEMCNVIIGQEGTVDKFEGDAIMAFWGAPALHADHAKRACFAAIDMRQAIVKLRDEWIASGHAGINVRMGLNSGLMVVGNMGSVQRLNYTIMGDAVNLASRLEGANKAYGSGILISEHTQRKCEGDIDVREIDTIRVVGKSEAVRVFQLLERKGKTAGALADLVVAFEKARRFYTDRDYTAAAVAFRACLDIDPADGPSKVFLQRCEEFVNHPPRKDWDGVFVLDAKG